MDEATDTTAPTVLVAVKHVPVGGAFLRVDDGALTRDGVSHGMDPLNEVALEWALRAREAGTVGRVVCTTLGPPEAVDTLRRALAMGADEVVLVTDPALRGADVRTTGRALAATARQVGASLLLMGYESLDGSSGAVPALVATLLDWPLLTRLGDGELLDGVLRGTRDLGAGPETIEADLPAVASFVEGEVTPRYPKLKDVLRTKSAEPTTWAADVLGIGVAADGERVLRLVEVPQPKKEPRVVGLEEGVDELFALLTAGAGNG
jgi:electron transfer flavoprotein beta subunit